MRRFGRRLAEAGIGVVYGGASTGLMGVLADSALAHGGEVIGVIPRDLVAHEVPHTGLTGFVHFQRQRLSICLSSSECPASP
ncbi:LOG family protein [Streptomyces sp. 900116325]